MTTPSALESSCEITITIKMSEEYAAKLERSLGRIMQAAGDHLAPERYTPLVNTATIDHLLALRMAIVKQLPGTFRPTGNQSSTTKEYGTTPRGAEQ